MTLRQVIKKKLKEGMSNVKLTFRKNHTYFYITTQLR